MLGYHGFVRLTDGQHSEEIQKPSKIVIHAEGGTKTEIYVDDVDFGKKRSSNYHGRFVTCIVGHKTTHKRRLLEEQRYGVKGGGYFRNPQLFIPYADKTWTGKHGTIKRRTELHGNKGICYTRFCRGAFREQYFNYFNGQRAYRFTYKDAEIQVRYPTGEKWIVVLSKTPICPKVSGHFNAPYGHLGEGNSLFDSKDNRFTGDLTYIEYDRKGRIKTLEKYENRQRTGEYIKNYVQYFYINGLEVPKKLYYAKPEQLKAKKIMRLANAQARVVFLKKIGLERVVKECEGVLVDKDKRTGNELWDFKTGAKHNGREEAWNSNEIDTIERILKVICPSTHQAYYLRIPYDENFNTCEKARQGTFNGFEVNGEKIEFALET